jgi:TusA-related sulfurtransferase
MYSFDLRESIFSFSLLQITNLFSKIKPGEVIEITGRGKKFISDIKRVLPDFNYEIIVSEMADGREKAFQMKLIKKGN